jgi:hypothetical protein
VNFGQIDFNNKLIIFGNGQRAMSNGQRAMGNRQWAMGSEETRLFVELKCFLQQLKKLFLFTK